MEPREHVLFAKPKSATLIRNTATTLSKFHTRCHTQPPFRSATDGNDRGHRRHIQHACYKGHLENAVSKGHDNLLKQIRHLHK